MIDVQQHIFHVHDMQKVLKGKDHWNLLSAQSFKKVVPALQWGDKQSIPQNFKDVSLRAVLVN